MLVPGGGGPTGEPNILGFKFSVKYYIKLIFDSIIVDVNYNRVKRREIKTIKQLISETTNY